MNTPNLKVPTSKQFRFIMDESENFASTVDISKINSIGLKGSFTSDEKKFLENTVDDNFKYLMDKMLNSTDDEIRVELPRLLMAMGFREFIDRATLIDGYGLQRVYGQGYAY
jgi:hypothetical protein